MSEKDGHSIFIKNLKEFKVLSLLIHFFIELLSRISK